MDKLDLLVVVDPYPSATAAMAAMPGRPEDLNAEPRGLPAAGRARSSRPAARCTASNRSLQWREKVIEPLWESRSDHMIMHQFADKLGFGKELSKNYKMQKVKGMDEPVPEDILREINKCVLDHRLHRPEPGAAEGAHAQHGRLRRARRSSAKGGKDKATGYDMTGDYFGLPWPCWGTPELKHPGTPNLYDTSKHVMDGGGNFRANFGVERDGENLLAEDGSHSLGADITTGYPEFDHVLLKKLGWWDELTDAEKAAAEGKNWKTDNSGGIIRVVMKNHGCHPFGNAKARAVVWNFPDADSAAPRAAVRHPARPGGQVPDARRQEGVLAPAHAVQDACSRRTSPTRWPRSSRSIMTSGRLVEYEGGGEETRSNPWLAELQQEMFVEINPKVAAEQGHPQRRARLGAHADRRAG